MAGGEVAETNTSAEVNELAEYVLGDTLKAVADEFGYDSVVAYTVSTTEGANFLYVIAIENNQFSLHSQAGLFTDAKAAIQGYISANYGNYTLETYEGPLTEAEIAANAYIAGSYGFTTLAEVAAEVGAPVEFLEVYATDWDGWSDAVAVLHIGDYYIGWYWL